MCKFLSIFRLSNLCLIVDFHFIDKMTKLTTKLAEELKSFRSRLYEIDLDEPRSDAELNVILDAYIDNHFEVFCEEYVIAGFDVALVRKSNS